MGEGWAAGLRGYSRYLIQNAVFFAALLFSGRYSDVSAVLSAVTGYVILSVFSLQHLVLFREDGTFAVPKRFVRFVHLAGAVALLLFSLMLNRPFGLLCCLILIIRYSHVLWFRLVPVINIAFLPIELAVKGMAGAVMIAVPLSGWGLISLLLLGLLISFGKAKNLATYTPNAVSGELYSPKVLNEMMAVVSSSTILAYCMYSIAPETIAHLGNENLLYSAPFVVYGIFRFLWLINMVDLKSEIELVLFRDRAMSLNLLGWIASIVVVLSTSPLD